MVPIPQSCGLPNADENVGEPRWYGTLQLPHQPARGGRTGGCAGFSSACLLACEQDAGTSPATRTCLAVWQARRCACQRRRLAPWSSARTSYMPASKTRPTTQQPPSYPDAACRLPSLPGKGDSSLRWPRRGAGGRQLGERAAAEATAQLSPWQTSKPDAISPEIEVSDL